LVQGTPGAKPASEGTPGAKPASEGTPGDQGGPETPGKVTKNNDTLKREITKYIENNSTIISDLITKSETITVANDKELDRIHKNLARAQSIHTNILNNFKLLGTHLKSEQNTGGSAAAPGTEGPDKEVPAVPGVPEVPVSTEQDPQEDDAYKKLINKEYVAATASEYYREEEIDKSFNAQVEKLGTKEYNEKIKKVNYDINQLEDIYLDTELEDELPDMLDSIENYNNLVKKLNENYLLQNVMEKKGGGAKNYVKESMQLIKDSHELISKIIQEKSKNTKKIVNKKIKNITNKIRR
jgi:hypothetical protein